MLRLILFKTIIYLMVSSYIIVRVFLFVSSKSHKIFFFILFATFDTHINMYKCWARLVCSLFNGAKSKIWKVHTFHIFPPETRNSDRSLGVKNAGRCSQRLFLGVLGSYARVTILAPAFDRRRHMTGHVLDCLLFFFLIERLSSLLLTLDHLQLHFIFYFLLYFEENFIPILLHFCFKMNQ